MRILFLMFILSFTHSVQSNEYGDWEKKYPEYKQFFELNKQLDVNYTKVDEIREEIIKKLKLQKKQIVDKKDMDKLEYLDSIYNDSRKTHLIMSSFGQGLLLSFSSKLSNDLKRFHFHELCQNLVWTLPIRVSSYKNLDTYKNPKLEWGREVFMTNSDLKLISLTLEKEFELSKWMDKTCSDSLIDKKFWTVN